MIENIRLAVSASNRMGNKGARIAQRATHTATRNEVASCRVRISNSRVTPRRMYLRRPHHLPSVPNGPSRLSTRLVDKDDSKRTLENQSSQPTYQIIPSRRDYFGRVGPFGIVVYGLVKVQERSRGAIREHEMPGISAKLLA